MNQEQNPAQHDALAYISRYRREKVHSERVLRNWIVHAHRIGVPVKDICKASGYVYRTVRKIIDRGETQ